MGMRKYNTSVNNITITVTDFGGVGKPILLLHGAMGRGSCWRPVTDSLISKGYRVLAIDQRGHGTSERTASYAISEFVNDVIETINQEIKEKVLLIGHSLGGLVAIKVAAARPDLIRGLVIEDISCDVSRIDINEYKEWFLEWPVPFVSMYDVHKYFFNVRPGLENYFQEVFIEKQDGYYPIFSYDDILAAISSEIGENFWDDLKQIKCETLVLKGECSEFPREDLQKMSEQLELGKYAEIRKAYHVTHHDSPDQWGDEVISFLSTLS